MHTNLPRVGFELGYLVPRTAVLPIEPTLLVEGKNAVKLDRKETFEILCKSCENLSIDFFAF